MGEWSTYAVANFVPFTAEVYLRLIERVNGEWWPLHLAVIAVAIAVLIFTASQRQRLAGLLLLALLWAWCGYGFFHHFYANLNWAGGWIGWAFIFQGVLFGLSATFAATDSRIPAVRTGLGWLLTAAGAGWPLATVLGRDDLQQMEVIGMHPDPTAVFSLGVLLITVRGGALALALPIPLLWCLISGLTLQVLGLPQAPLLYGVVAVVVAAVLAGFTTGRPG